MDGEQLAGPDECEYAQHRRGHERELSAVRCRLPVGGDNGLHPAESQNVVPLISMTTTAAPRLTADSSPWRILSALTASISAGTAATACGPTHRTWQSSVGMATAFLAADAGA